MYYNSKILEWAKSITSTYPQVEVNDLSLSWSDGLAFCAIAHHFQTESLDFNSLNKEDKIGNLTQSFKVFEKLGITPTPDPAVIAETPDAKVIGPLLVMIHNKLTGKTLQLSFQDPDHLKIPHLRLPSIKDQDPLSDTFSSSHQLPPTANSLKPDQTIKVVLLGDRAVGKTALFERWKNGVFVPTQATIGIELWTRLYSCKGKIIQVQVWDTAGQELHNAITKSYYRQAQGAFLVYDITSTESFQNISNWSKRLLDVVPESNKPHILLVGNKKDLESERAVSVAEAQEYANDHGYKFIETSAKQGNECQKSFQLLFQEIYKTDLKNSPHESDDSPKLDTPYRQDSCSCST